MHSLSELRRMQDTVRVDNDVGEEFYGDRVLVADVLEVLGKESTGHWQQILTLYCSKLRCERCPHGPYLFSWWLDSDGERFGCEGVYEYVAGAGLRLRRLPAREKGIGGRT